MYWVAQAWDKAASSALLDDSLTGKRVPLLIGLWELARDGCQHASEKSASVFCDTENGEPPPSRPAAIAPWSASGALYRVRRATIAVGVKP